MKWNQLFSHNTRRQEGTADSLLRLLAPSLLGMAVCVLTLCSLTWAWFNMNVGSSITGIQSSEVEVCLVNNNDDGTWSATPLVENENGTSNATTDAEGKIYFIARGTAANAYLKIGNKYYGPLDLAKGPDASGNYPVYSITLSDASSSSVSVSLHWGLLPTGVAVSGSATLVENATASWDGTVSFSQFNSDGDEASNTLLIIDPSANDSQLQPETPANGDTGDNTSDVNNDDAQTPDGSTDTGGDPDSSTEKVSAEKSDGDTTLDGSVVKAAAD